MMPCSRSSKPTRWHCRTDRRWRELRGVERKRPHELEAFEEKFLDGVKQAVQSSSDPIKEQWKSILDNIPRGATKTGAQVAETLSARAREAQVAMRSSREAGLKATHTMTQNYATLVSGVLIGLSERPLNRERSTPPWRVS
jgi:Family of unknown function (DUF6781)